MDRRDWLKLSLSGTAALIFGSVPALVPRKVPPKGFRSGLEAIDDYTGCWDRGDLVTIMGEPAAGKTAMARQIAVANAEDGHKVAVLTDGDELSWRNSGLQTKRMPDEVADVPQFGAILNSLDADLIIIDAQFPMFYTARYSGLGLSNHRLMCVSTLLTHCQQYHHQRSALITFQTRKMDYRPYIMMSRTEPSLIHYASSRIFKVTKHRDLDLVDVRLTKNRTGFQNASFFYKHALVSGYDCADQYIKMVPVPTLKWDSISHDESIG